MKTSKNRYDIICGNRVCRRAVTASEAAQQLCVTNNAIYRAARYGACVRRKYYVVQVEKKQNLSYTAQDENLLYIAQNEREIKCMSNYVPDNFGEQWKAAVAPFQRVEWVKSKGKRLHG